MQSPASPASQLDQARAARNHQEQEKTSRGTTGANASHIPADILAVPTSLHQSRLVAPATQRMIARHARHPHPAWSTSLNLLRPGLPCSFRRPPFSSPATLYKDIALADAPLSSSSFLFQEQSKRVHSFTRPVAVPSNNPPSHSIRSVIVLHVPTTIPFRPLLPYSPTNLATSSQDALRTICSGAGRPRHRPGCCKQPIPRSLPWQAP